MIDGKEIPFDYNDRTKTVTFQFWTPSPLVRNSASDIKESIVNRTILPYKKIRIPFTLALFPWRSFHGNPIGPQKAGEPYILWTRHWSVNWCSSAAGYLSSGKSDKMGKRKFDYCILWRLAEYRIYFIRFDLSIWVHDMRQRIPIDIIWHHSN